MDRMTVVALAMMLLVIAATLFSCIAGHSV